MSTNSATSYKVIVSLASLNHFLSVKDSSLLPVDFISCGWVQYYIFKCTTMVQKTSLFVNAETKCVRFYHPERKAGELLRLCRNDECICAEGKQEMTLHTFFLTSEILY